MSVLYWSTMYQQIYAFQIEQQLQLGSHERARRAAESENHTQHVGLVKIVQWLVRRLRVNEPRVVHHADGSLLGVQYAPRHRYGNRPPLHRPTHKPNRLFVVKKQLAIAKICP